MKPEEIENLAEYLSKKIKGKKLNEVLRNLTSEENQDLIQILEGLVDVYVQTSMALEIEEFEKLNALLNKK